MAVAAPASASSVQSSPVFGLRGGGVLFGRLCGWLFAGFSKASLELFRAFGRFLSQELHGASWAFGWLKQHFYLMRKPTKPDESEIQPSVLAKVFKISNPSNPHIAIEA